VLLSAGALQSPQLLQLSGIGPAALLRSMASPCRPMRPRSGANLQDHYQARVIVKLKARQSLERRLSATRCSWRRWACNGCSTSAGR
jgi:choline dehydrogenase